MANKKKIFLSFDLENDDFLKDSLTEQAKRTDSPFEISNFSRPISENDWLDKTRERIRKVDVFVVALGSKTKASRHVLKETEIADELNKPAIQIIGYRNGSEDWAVPAYRRARILNSEYLWKWENLRDVFQENDIPTSKRS